MNTKEEVLKIGKKLEKLIADNAADHASVSDLLKTLKSFKITLDILEKTRIGVTVNNLRKSVKSDEIISVSKSLIKSWRKLVPDEKGHGDHRTRRDSTASEGGREERSPPPRRFSSVSEGSTGESLRLSRDSRPSTSSESSEVPRTSISENDQEQDHDSGGLSPPRDVSPVEVDDTRDSTRIKCREMLVEALHHNGHVEGSRDYKQLAAEIEQFVYRQFDNTGMKYIHRIRSLITNLKDVKNPQLRENVLQGRISSKQFAVMSPEEMASEEMKKLRRRLSQEAFNDHQLAVCGGTTSDLFQCTRCGKRNTTYNQLQTRSSDEPMTTFVLCNECGNRWKFC